MLFWGAEQEINVNWEKTGKPLFSLSCGLVPAPKKSLKAYNLLVFPQLTLAGVLTQECGGIGGGPVDSAYEESPPITFTCVLPTSHTVIHYT